MVVKQITSILLGGGLVSALNLLVYFYALAALGNDIFSKVVVLLALFFGCVDVFNSGSSKILIKKTFLEYRKKIVLLDFYMSIFAFFLFFILINFFFAIFNIELSFSWFNYLILLAFFVIYLTTQFHLGFLRYTGRNHVVSMTLAIIPVFRIMLILIYELFDSLESFICIWLFIEVAPGIIYYMMATFKFTDLPESNSSWPDFMRKYRPYLYSNWSSNFIYSFSKHFDVIIFSTFFSIQYVPYYRIVKSFCNIAFNLGGSVVVYIFRFISINSFIKIKYFLQFIALYLSIALINLYTFPWVEIPTLLSGDVYFDIYLVIYLVTLSLMLFLPIVISRVLHYSIQIIRPKLFIFLSMIDICLLFITMLFFYFFYFEQPFISSIYILVVYAFLTIVLFFTFCVALFRKVTN